MKFSAPNAATNIQLSEEFTGMPINLQQSIINAIIAKKIST